MTIPAILCAYLILVNVLTFIVFGLDKGKATTHSRRIKEKTLLLLSVFGAFPGGWLAMFLFRHKIKKPVFLFFMVLITVSWLIGIIVFLTLNP